MIVKSLSCLTFFISLTTSIKFFKSFCQLMEKDGKLPLNSESEMVQAYLTAKMHIARLYVVFVVNFSSVRFNELQV